MRAVFDALAAEVIEARILRERAPSATPTPPVVMYARPPPMQRPVTPSRVMGPLEALGAQLDAQATLSDFQHAAATLLSATQTLTAAAASVQERSRARASQDPHGGVPRDEAAGLGTHDSMNQLVGQLQLVASSLKRSERLLAPLPSLALDHSAYSLLQGEVSVLGEQLHSTRRALAELQTAKAAKCARHLCSAGFISLALVATRHRP